MSKLTPKLSALDLPFSTFFEVAIFCGIFVDFGLTFGVPLAPFGLILVPFWLKLGSFWCHVGPDLGYFAPSGVSFWLVLGEIHFLRQKFVKNTPALTLVSNFLQIFACKLSSLGPGAELLPQATEIDLRKGTRTGCQKALRIFVIWVDFGSHFPSKIDEKIDVKIYAEKVMKIDEQSMRI